MNWDCKNIWQIIGIASRRKAEEYILEGKVSVNGKVVTALGVKVDPDKDTVCFEGKPIEKQEEKVYILLNKPIGYVTTVKDQFNRDTVMDLVKVKQRIVPIGRLDMYTSGALILTNDGDLVYHITHPKHQIDKTYTVTVRGNVSKEELEQLQRGLVIDGYKTSKAKAKIIKRDEEKNITRLAIVIHEGRNRQVRKMCEAIEKPVLALHRSKIGNIEVKNLKLRYMALFNQRGNWKFKIIGQKQ